MAARDDIQRVAAALEKPPTGYVKRLETVQKAMATRSREASRQLGVFVERVVDLTTEELRELHDETFRDEKPVIRPLITRLAHRRTCRDEAGAALRALAPLLDRLEADRNPFAYVVRSLCCLLLDRVTP
jgi:nitrate reductase assembly molybdenum cofactor insertion protein NarJ